MVATPDFDGRRAPYAPISALRKFFERIRDRSVPDHVDHHFLAKLNVASKNEYSLLSALKFLGILDDRGVPTHAYRLLQASGSFEDTLRHLVLTAYKPVFQAGGETWPDEDLINFFRLASSASQAKNAARFFRAVCTLSGIEPGDESVPAKQAQAVVESKVSVPRSLDVKISREERSGDSTGRSVSSELRDSVSLLEIKGKLLEKLPQVRPEWSAAEYIAICTQFAEMLKRLEAP